MIESSRERYLAIEEEFEHAAQYGDATELWVLERAGIQRADLVIAVTGDDEDNMLVCQVAKEKYLCDRIIARVNNPRNHDHFRLLGIQPAVSATDLILRRSRRVPRYGLATCRARRGGPGDHRAGGLSRRRRSASAWRHLAARRQPDHLGAARRLWVRPEGRHGDPGGRRGAARARPRAGGRDHRLLCAQRAPANLTFRRPRPSVRRCGLVTILGLHSGMV